MNILFISLGTQGDIEPFLALAAQKKDEKNEITCLFPEQFRALVDQLGYRFIGFDSRFLELITSDFGKAFLGGNGNWFKKGVDFIRLIRASFNLQSILIRQQKQAIESMTPDLVFFHPKAVYCLLAAYKNPEKYIHLSPVPCILHPHSDFPHLGLSKFKPFHKKWNLASYKLLSTLKYLALWSYLKPYLRSFDGKPLTKKSLAEFEQFGLTTWYQLSPSLFPKPAYWPENSKVTGYLSRNQAVNYQPDPKLLSWLKRNPKAILLTFGSMANPNPAKTTEVLLKILEAHRIPTLVNLSWGGLVKPSTSSELFFFVENIPYDWVLPNLYGIIHHGGSGTTHSAAKAGAAQLLVPHIMDQYFWNRLVANQGLGPLGIPIAKLKEKTFEKVVLEFWENEFFKKNAMLLRDKIANEN